jgi:phosphoglycolate phosphatase-like HAD superfamily hydrolase
MIVKRKSKTSIIFDYDGVIANTDLSRFKLLNDILSEYNIELAKSHNQKDLIGLSTNSFLLKNFKSLSQIEIDEIVYKRHELFFSNLNRYCLPYDNMKETVAYFHSKFELAIVTTNSLENVKVQLDFLGIRNYFKWIVGREICENKEFVKTYGYVSDTIDREISSCIVIEDSDVGVNAAVEEGYYCIRFDPENIFAKGNENERAMNFVELKEKIEKHF